MRMSAKRSSHVNSSLVNHGEEKVGEMEDGNTLIGQVENLATDETEADHFE